MAPAAERPALRAPAANLSRLEPASASPELAREESTRIRIARSTERAMTVYHLVLSWISFNTSM